MMKKTLMAASFAAALLACNNGSDSTTADTSNHAAHHKGSPGNGSETSANPMKEIMDNMMQDMHGSKPTGNNDIDFATMMIKHHQGAVEMSKAESAKGVDTALRQFAQTVINEQEKEIGFMQGVISKSSKTPSPNAAAFGEALNGSMMAMMTDSSPFYNHIDRDFAAQMIPHHQSAVDMAKAYLQYGKDADLRTLCQNIIASQTKEIDWLKGWLAKNDR